jgi:hypothetical protein
MLSMKKILRTHIVPLSFMVTFINLNAQQNLPLVFKEDVIKWSELSWMDGQPGDDQLVLMASPPQIKEDTIYLFMNYYQTKQEDGKNYGYCGYIIKKLNLTTGEKYWETSRMFKEYGNRKILSRPTFLDGRIEIALYDESHAIGMNTIWNECYPGHIVLDRHSGIIVDSNYVDKINTQLPRFRSFGNPIFIFSGQTRPTIFKTKTGYHHIRSWLEEMVIHRIDDNFNYLGVDSIKYPMYDFRPRFVNFEQVESDSFWVLMLNRTSDWSEIQVLLSKYDEDFERYETIDVTEHIQYPMTQGGFYFMDRGFIMFETHFTNFVDTTLKFHTYLFDNVGEFIDSISYTLVQDIDGNIIYGWLWPLVDRVNNRILMTQSRQDSSTVGTYLEMYENTGASINRINRIHVEGLSDHFRTSYSTMLDNGDILLYIHQFTDPGATGDRWYSWIMLDGQKMNVTSNTSEIYSNVVRNKLNLYPNPTTGMVDIQNLENPVSVRIYTLTGTLVKATDNIIDQIDLTVLPAGMYIIDLRSKFISERHKILKIE